jgi:ketosteroid isomerase-like protein
MFGRALLRSVLAAVALMTLLEVLASADSPEAPQNEIRSALEKWRSAFNDRDERQVCDLFAPDLIANYQGQPELNYASLCQLLLNSLDDSDRIFRYSFDINDIQVYGEIAVVRLVWTLETEKNDAAKETIREPAVDIFRRQPDGSWKISRYLAYPAPP